MLVPVTQWIGTRISSRTFSTPTCARPRAPPPDSARPMRGAVVLDAADSGAGAVCALACAHSSEEIASAMMLNSACDSSRLKFHDTALGIWLAMKSADSEATCAVMTTGVLCEVNGLRAQWRKKQLISQQHGAAQSDRALQAR